MSRLYVCGLEAMPGHVAALRVERVITLLQPEWQPPTPPEIHPDHHHRVEINDITAPDPAQILPQRHHVEALIAFLEASRGASLLVHCFAGVSRSTAAALIAMVLDAPGHEREAAQLLRRRALYAQPNRLILEHADDILGREGALLRARDHMGPAADPSECLDLLELPRTIA